MTHCILLTGAGFTKNWGGWLAKELEGDLLARLAEDVPLRTLVQSSTNFEQALGLAREGASGIRPMAAEQVKRLEEAIKASFWAMNAALLQREDMEFSYDDPFQSVQSFLGRFDAIFTLNQDLLLELHYDPSRHVPQRWKEGSYYPGTEPPLPPKQLSGELLNVDRRICTVGPPLPERQPIYKLHGSVNWSDGTDALFLVGSGKEDAIRNSPLLSAYFGEFDALLRTPNTRLMIIGYGFADAHVNRYIVNAAGANPTLGLYYVHPKGRDAVSQDGAESNAAQLLLGLRAVPCVGESRRDLRTTFDQDRLEFDKLMRFFA